MSAQPDDYGLAELIGSLVLIAIVAGGITLIAIAVLSHPLPPQIPAVNFRFSTTGNSVSIYHAGGDPIPEGQFQICIDNVDIPATLLTKSPTSGGSWATGDTITITQTGISPSSFVQVLYLQGGSPQSVLATNGTR